MAETDSDLANPLPADRHGSPPGWDRETVQRNTISVLAISTIATRGAISALFTVAALAIKDMLDSGTWAGLSTVSITVGGAAAATLLASYMGRRGRTPGITLGYGVAAVGAVIAMVGIQVSSLVIYLGGLVLVGVGSGTANLARYAAADLATEERRSRDISLVIFSSTFGSVGGPLLVGAAAAVAVAAGLKEKTGAFGLAVVLFVIGGGVIFAKMRPDPLTVANDLGLTTTQTKKSFSEALQIILGSPLARLALFSLVISQAVMVMVMAMTPLHMEAHDHSLGNIGGVISAHTAGMFAFAPVAGWVSDRVGRLRAIGIGAGVLLLSTVITALASSAPNLLMYPGLYLLGLGWSFGIVAGSALLTESVDPSERVSVQGAADMATNLASGTGALASGFVFEMQGYHILSMIGTVAAGVLVLQGFWQYRMSGAGLAADAA